MDKESKIEFQKIDCNCNDCIFMERDFERFQLSVEMHHRWQLDYFNTIKNKLKKKAKGHLKKGENQKHNALMKEARNMKFQFDKKECIINYGNCSKLKKKISFIPNVLQLHTQDCFKHRRS